MLYTNNPVRNMEDHERRLEEENARREVFAYCEQCGDAIYKASSEHDGDEYMRLKRQLQRYITRCFQGTVSRRLLTTIS